MWSRHHHNYHHNDENGGDEGCSGASIEGCGAIGGDDNHGVISGDVCGDICGGVAVVTE